MKRRILLFLLLLAIKAPNIWAQSAAVKGTVTDAETGETLPGVGVQVEGTTLGGSTDAGGNYQISVSSKNAVLIFSYLGFTTQRVQVNGRTTVNIKLEPDVQALKEVVVVGYGTQRKADVTSSITTVDADDLENLPVTGIEQALQGRAAGVTVTSASGIPGAGVSVRIRGVGTVNNNEPLYIVDGVPVGGMNYLNPEDIESIQVLKDASAAAIYGSRAANGVVLITTKRGKEGKPTVSFDSYVGLNNPWQDYKPADREEYLYMFKSVHGENSADYATAKAEYDMGYNTNWWDETIKSGAVQNYNLAITGGTDNMHYNVSGAYFDQKGMFEPAGYNRLSARVNTDFTLSKRIKVGENLSISNQTTKNTNNAILQAIQQYDPLVPVIDPSRDQSDPFNKWGNSNITFGSSPLANLTRQIGDNKNLRMVGNIYGSLDIVDGLVFNTNYGFDIRRNETRSFGPTYFFDPSDKNDLASAGAGSITTNGWIWSNTLTYTKSFGDHNLSVLGGTQAEQTESHWINGSKFGQPGNEDRFRFIDAGTTGDIVNGNANEFSLASYFGRINYNYNDRYLLSASVRRDGSSNFARGQRWGTFPAFSAGWVISQEKFWSTLNLPWFSQLKIRGGWGQLGNQNIPGGAYTSFIEGGVIRRFVLNDGTVVQAYGIANTGNSLIQWETSEQSNIGFELGFFNGGLTIEGDYYNRKTKDMLIAYPLPSTIGLPSPWVNAGTVQNKGFDLTVNYQNNSRELKYSIGGNISRYKNEVTGLGEGQPYVESYPGARVTGTSRTAVGRPIGEFYGYRTAGIFQSIEEVNAYKNSEGALLQPSARAGDFRFADVNNDGSINDGDKTEIGNPHPKFTYGANVNLNYKAFDLSVFIQGSYGNKLFNINKYIINRPIGFDNIAAGAAYDAWTPENRSNTNPIMSVNDPNNNFRPSDYFVEDGSYMRIKNVQLGYNFPKSVLSTLKVSRIRVYVSAQNLFTFTDYSGLDPEVGAYSVIDAGQSQRLMGTDYFTFPQARTFQFGVNLNF